MPSAALESLDLSALLCSRVCHDLISPSGAIVNGLEVYEDAQDEETKAFALNLIKKSAARPTHSMSIAGIATSLAGFGAPLSAFGAKSDEMKLCAQL